MMTVAVLDSDARVVDALARRLDTGFRVVRATDAVAALDAIESQHADVLVTDILGTGLDALGLVAEARRIRPNLPIVVVSTFRDPGQAGGRVVYRYTVPGSRWPRPEDRARLIGSLIAPPQPAAVHP